MALVGIERRPASKSQLLHFSVVGSIVFGIIFFACWMLALVPIGATHAFIALFTTAETTSQAALVNGLCWSLIFGAWAGFLIAAVHKIMARVGL